MKSLYSEHRCTCNHLLFKGLILAGSRIEIKCKKCGKIVSLGDTDSNQESDSHFAITFDKSGKIVSASASSERILGYSQTDFKKMTVFDLSKNSTERGYQQLWQAITSNPEKMFYFDGAFSKKTGPLVDFRCKFRLEKSGSQQFLMVFYNTNKEISNTLPDHTNDETVAPVDFVIEIDINSSILYVTRLLTQHLNIKEPAEIMGKDLQNLIKINNIESLLKTRKTFSVKKQSFGGKKGEFHLIFTPLYHPDNQIKGYKIMVLPENN